MTKPNPVRGEAALGSRLLRVTFNGWCVLQGETSKQMNVLLQELDGEMNAEGVVVSSLYYDPSALRQWIRVFLTEDVSAEEAGDIIDETGMDVAFQALRDAVQNFFAPATEEKPKNPRKAA